MNIAVTPRNPDEPKGLSAASSSSTLPAPWLLLASLLDANLIPDPGPFKVMMILLRYSAQGTGLSCYPSRERICEQGGMSLRTVQRHLTELEEKSLIRVYRSHRKPNHYYINHKLIQAAARDRRDEKEKQEALNLHAWITELDHEVDTVSAFDESVSSLPPSEPNSEMRSCTNANDLIELVCEFWPEHPSLALGSGLHGLRASLEECAALVGSYSFCGAILVEVGGAPKKWQAVANSTYLSRYIQISFPKWLEAFRDQLGEIHPWKNEPSQ